MTGHAREAGFTLVEILVAVFAFSLMMGAGSMLLLSTLRSQSLVDAKLEQLGALEVATAHFRADFEASVPRVVSTGRISDRPRSMFGGAPDRDGVFSALYAMGGRIWTRRRIAAKCLALSINWLRTI